ncbi:hypothetical protein ACJX0J_035950, partial [Zea mays]
MHDALIVSKTGQNDCTMLEYDKDRWRGVSDSVKKKGEVEFIFIIKIYTNIYIKLTLNPCNYNWTYRNLLKNTFLGTPSKLENDLQFGKQAVSQIWFISKYNEQATSSRLIVHKRDNMVFLVHFMLKKYEIIETPDLLISFFLTSINFEN